MANRTTRLSDVSLFLLRIGAGLFLALLHGWGKIVGAFGYFVYGAEWGFVGGVAAMGFPFPAFFALCASLAEFVGGLMVAAGLFCRYAATFVVINMGVAVYRHLTTDMRFELAALFLLIAIHFAVAGAGKLSLDAWRAKR